MVLLSIKVRCSLQPFDLYIFYTGEKQLKPISGRVGEIAEFVLQNLMEKTVSILLLSEYL